MSEQARLHLKRAASDAPKIRSPVEFAEAVRIHDADRFEAANMARARDAEIARWCVRKAEAAEREAEEHETACHGFDRIHRCEGQAVAWRGTAAILRGLGK